jgi:outer membrane protein assembly factor BamB
VSVRSALAGKNPDGWGYLLVKVWADAVEFLDVQGTAAPAPIGAVRRAEWRPAPALPVAPFRDIGGRVLWKADLAKTVAGPAVGAGGSLFAATLAGDVVRWDGQGRLRWTSGAGGVPTSAPEPAGSLVWIAAASGRLSALDAETGRLVRSRKLDGPATSSAVFLPTGPAGKAAVLVATSRGESGILSCLDAATLDPLWVREDAGGVIQARPLVAGGKIVYGSWDGYVRALALEDGREAWRWSGNPNFYYAPAGCAPRTDGRRVFVCAPDGFVSCLDLATGAQIWREKRGAWESLGVSPDGKRVLVKGLAGEFSVIDAATGALVRKTAPAHGPSDILPVVPLEKDGRVLYGAQDGTVYEIDPEGRIAPLLYLGAAAVHSLQPLRDDVFAATNADGLVVVFRWR